MSVELIIDETIPEEVFNTTNNVSKLTEKLHKAGIDVLATILREAFHCRITNLKNSRVELEKRRKIAIDAILCEKALNNDETKANAIIEKYFADKPKKEKNNSWLEKFEVDEQVLVYNSHISSYIKGQIQKINKNSITIQLFASIEVDDEEAMKNQTYGYNRLIWQNFSSGKVIKYNKEGIIKKGENNWSDELFIEGKRSVDYGK